MEIIRARLTPADANAATLYAVDAKVDGQLCSGARGEGYVVVHNTSGSTVACTVYIDTHGATYDDTTVWRMSAFNVPAGRSIDVKTPELLRGAERLGVKSASGGDVIFTYIAKDPSVPGGLAGMAPFPGVPGIPPGGGGACGGCR